MTTPWQIHRLDGAHALIEVRPLFTNGRCHFSEGASRRFTDGWFHLKVAGAALDSPTPPDRLEKNERSVGWRKNGRSVKPKRVAYRTGVAAKRLPRGRRVAALGGRARTRVPPQHPPSSKRDPGGRREHNRRGNRPSCR